MKLRQFFELFSLLVSVVLLSGCLAFPISGDYAPVNPPNIPTSDLLLDESPFPLGWEFGYCEPNCNISPKESSRDFYSIDVPGNVVQNVLYYRTQRDAEAKFQRSQENLGLSHSYPSEIDYISPIAHEQYLVCGIDKRSGVKNCRSARRYGNYFVEFYFDLDQGFDDGLPSIKDVEPILRALDEQVSEKLGIPPPAGD